MADSKSWFPVCVLKDYKSPEEEEEENPEARRERELSEEVEFRGYAELALSDYNMKHGTDLILSVLLDYECHEGGWLGHAVDFEYRRLSWVHINLVANRRHTDASDKPLTLFAELYVIYDQNLAVPTRLALLKPEDDLHGCCRYPCEIRIPYHRVRTGFIDDCPMEAALNRCTLQTRSMKAAGVERYTVDCYGILTKRQKLENADMAKFALTEYNKRHGTNLEFVRAWKCQTFKSTGLVKDFSEKETTWKHLNFVAKRPERAELIKQGFACYKEVILFAEMYLEDGYGYVLTTLSRVLPQAKQIGCAYCPASIVHPRFDCFN